jgi:hypothetical protein
MGANNPVYSGFSIGINLGDLNRQEAVINRHSRSSTQLMHGMHACHNSQYQVITVVNKHRKAQQLEIITE